MTATRERRKRMRETAPNWKGGVTYDRHGYRLIRVLGSRGSAKYAPEHVLIAENTLGRRLPKQHPVHHVDENKANNTNHNLVICENRAYHLLLHARQRILKAGGHPDQDRICGRCHLLKPREAFDLHAQNWDGRRGHCKQCRHQQYRESYDSSRSNQTVRAVA